MPLLRPGSSGSNLTVRIIISTPTGGAILGANSQAVLTITRVGGSASTIPAKPPTLQIQREDANLRILWTGTLQSAEAITGPWQDVKNAASPLTLSRPDGGRQFYRAADY